MMQSAYSDLRSFLDSLPRGGVGEFARKVGISKVYLSQLAAKQNDRVPATHLAVRIERASEFKVPRWNLRPKDWHEHWPELVGAPGAPAAPVCGADAHRLDATGMCAGTDGHEASS